MNPGRVYKTSTSAGFDNTGNAWLYCGDMLISQDGGVWNEPEARLYSRLFFDPQGRVWSPGSTDVSVLDNGEVKKYTAVAVTGEEWFPYRTAAFDGNGTVWLGGHNSKGSMLVSFDGSNWKAYGQDIGLPKDISADALLMTSKGDLLTATTKGVFKFDGTKFQQLIPDKRFTDLTGSFSLNQFNKMIELPGGTIWMASDDGIFTWDGEKLGLLDRQSGLPSSNIRDMALDAQGRVWVATAYGVAVQNGGKWQVALPSTSGMTDSDIMALAVKGAPALPPPAEAKTTTISGRVVQSNQPLTNVTVELCSEPVGFRRLNRGDSPCANHFFTKQAQTDDKGMYRIENVPIGAYGVAIRDENGRWYIPSRLTIVALEAGQEVTEDVDLGKQ